MPVLILDEAHLFPTTVFEPLRLLFSTEMDSQSLGVLLLVGQPELRRTLRLTPTKPSTSVSPPITTCHPSTWPKPWPTSATRSNRRLQGRALFTDDALTRIYDFTRAFPD